MRLLQTSVVTYNASTVLQVLGVPDVDATFGTAPEFWNVLLETIVKV
jgi:hypothetical protein